MFRLFPALPRPRAVVAAAVGVPAVLLAAVLLAAVLLAAVPAGSARAAEAVRVDDNLYSPASVTVRVGETVTWTWVGQNPHSVASGTFGSSHPGCSPLTTGACGGSGETFSHTFTEPGTVSYSCEVHGSMTGTVEVLADEPEPSPSPSPSPEPEPTALPTASEAPSPEPSATPSPSRSPSPSPSPSPAPSPSPTPTRTFGPPPPRATEPPVVVEPTGSESPASQPDPEVTLEPFPAPIDPDVAVVTEPDPVLEAAAEAEGDRDGPSAPAWVALGLVLGTLVAVVQFVLLGPEWTTED